MSTLCRLTACLFAIGLTVACAAGIKDHVNVGFEAFAKQDYLTAEHEFDQALKDDPNNPYALLNLAAVYQNTGRPQLAVPLYEKVLVTGKDIRPNRKANAGEKSQTLAEMAQNNLSKMRSPNPEP